MPPVQDADVTAMRDASVKITRAAYQKMSLYARLITEITGLNLECGGLLLDPSAAQDGVTRDIYLLPDQEVTESAGHFGNDSLMQAYGHLKKTRVQVLGLWHSHGSYPPFHSTPDRGTINRVYSFNAKVCPLEQGGEPMFLSNNIIFNKKGSIRGNHYHNVSRQHDFLIQGKFDVYSRKNNGGSIVKTLWQPYDLLTFEPGEVHEFVALEDSLWITFIDGLRGGDEYEKDTFRLEVPLHTLVEQE